MVRMMCGSNCARASTDCVRDHRAQTRSWAAVVFARPSCLNHNMAAHGGCWSRKASQMIVVGLSKAKDNRNSNGGEHFFNITDQLCHVKLCTLLCTCSCILLKDVVSSCSMEVVRIKKFSGPQLESQLDCRGSHWNWMGNSAVSIGMRMSCLRVEMVIHQCGTVF